MNKRGKLCRQKSVLLPVPVLFSAPQHATILGSLPPTWKRLDLHTQYN